MRILFLGVALFIIAQLSIAKILCVQDLILHSQFSSNAEHAHHENIDDSSESDLAHTHKHSHAPGEPEHEHSHNHATPNFLDHTVYFKSAQIPNYQIFVQQNAFLQPGDPKFLLIISDIFRPPIT